MSRLGRWWKRHNPLRLWHAHRWQDGDRWRFLGHKHTVLLVHSAELAEAHPELVPDR